ncbi:MAG: hypothetical protein SGPRY_010502, partial [Prymnesium sp.]
MRGLALLPLALAAVSAPSPLRWGALLPPLSSAPLRHAQPRLAAPSLSDLKVYELKAVCRAKGLKVSGRKAELIARIESAPLGVSSAKRRKPASQPVASPRKRGKIARKGAEHVVGCDEGGSEIRGLGRGEGEREVSEGMREDVNIGSGRAKVDVLDEAEVEQKERDARRAARRGRLSSYFSEEYSKLVTELQTTAGPSFSQAFSAGVEEVSIGAGAALIRIGRDVPNGARTYLQSVRERGRRLAWCKSFDHQRGVGVLVDMDEGVEIAVCRADLATSPRLPESACGLYPGEFIEYDPQIASSAEAGSQQASDRVSGW